MDHKQKILLVIDHYLVYETIKLFFIRNSFEVVWVSSGEQAILVCSTQPCSIDLVLMDNESPSIAGFEASEMIKKISPLLPIICISEGVIPYHYRHYFVAHHKRTVDFNQLMLLVSETLNG